MPGIVGRLAASELARVLGDGPPVMTDDDAVGIGLKLDRAARSAGVDGIMVIVEAYEAELRHGNRRAVEAVEAPAILDQLRALLFEDLPDRSFALLRMGMGLRPGQAFVDEPGVEIIVALAESKGFRLNRSRGVKNRSRTRPTWFSTWPFSQPEAGVQATGSTR